MFSRNDCKTQENGEQKSVNDISSRCLRFRHFGDEWQQICETLLSCEQLLTVMSVNEDNNCQTICDTIDDTSRLQLRQIIRSIEPKKYSKTAHKRSASGRRSSYHRLKALTQLLMTSNLKRSTSLQSLRVVKSPDDCMDDTTATLPRLGRRPRITRYYHSLDVSDDNNDDTNDGDDSPHKSGDRSGLSLVLSSSPSTQLLPTTAIQKQLNRHSCDVTSLLLSPSSQSSSQMTNSSPNGRQILKYSKKRLRGPYGEMLESMMNTKNNNEENDTKHNLSFIQELLRETEKQRQQLDTNAKETTGTAVVEATPETTTTSIMATIGRHLDTRTHIVGELYDTEKSFCEQLRDLVEKYSKPLTELLIIDSIFVEIIFGKIPEILLIHSKFLEGLRHRMCSWSPQETTVGDLFALFDEKSVSSAYLSFVDNWFEAKHLVKQLSRDKPLFQKFLTEQSREHRSKLSLDELMISVIQRIPRFELLLKQLLKNTAKEHKDYALLNNALKKIHSLALYINRVKNDADVISHSSSLSSTTTTAQLDVNQSSITISQLETICDGLPAAALLGSTLHEIAFVSIRKRERILLLFSNLLIIVSIKGKKKSQKFEENKYKVLNFFALDALDVNCNDTTTTTTTTNDAVVSDDNCLELLEKDLQILRTIQTSFVSRLSSSSRHFLDSVFQELSQNINKRMNEMKNSEKNLELLITSSQTSHELPSNQNASILLQFLNQEKRQKFYEILKELKSEKYSKNSKIIPEFLCFLPIRKTRAGLQFTCASPTMGTNDVWICNSDGFVGQISVLSLNAASGATIEPTVVSCNGVCNSRIICMTCVPKTTQTPSQTSEESDISDSDGGDTQSDSNTTSGRSRRQLDDALSRSALCSATMWFGTDDSSVHIYSCFDAIRIKKNKVKVTLSARVEAIAYFNERVFVCLANQSVAIFQREASGAWNTDPEIRAEMSCSRLCAVGGQRLWTSGHSNAITVRDSDLNALFDDIIVDDTTTSDDDFITQMVVVDDEDVVFVATHDSLSIHALSTREPFSKLNIISIHSTLLRALVSCEDIIRQHKSACLKISSLLAVKDKVWIGTSAGIICVLDSKSNQLEIVPNGHTGHVRFLTQMETLCARRLVISGGDGVEVYRTGPGMGTGIPTEGREDSTNHLLLWEISCE